MSLKNKLIKDKVAFIPNFDFTKNLSMEESAVLCYLIDLADYQNSDNKFMEVTPTFIHIKRPTWKVGTIRRALASLVEKGLINKAQPSGRGCKYSLNIKNIQTLITDDSDIKSITNINSHASRKLKPASRKLKPASRMLKPASRKLKQSITNQKHINNISIGEKTNKIYNIKPTSKNYKDILITINLKSCPQIIKDELIKFYTSKKGRYTVAQVSEAIDTIFSRSNNNWDLILQSINNSFINGWGGFYPVPNKHNNSFINTTQQNFNSSIVDNNSEQCYNKKEGKIISY